MKHKRMAEVVSLWIFMLLLFLTSTNGKKDSVATSNSPASSKNSLTPKDNKLQNNQSNINSTDAEEIPKPEALSWISDYADDTEALGGRLHITSKQVDKYLRSNPSKNDNYYRNRNGEWIYIVPEEELFADTSRAEYIFESKEPLKNSHYRRYPPPSKYYRDVRTYDQESSQLVPRYIRPVYRDRDPTPSYTAEDTGSLITKLINTGNGFLRYLNPLTYLRPKDPGPSYALYYPRSRQKYQSLNYRQKPTYQDSVSYRKRPSSYSQLYDEIPSNFGRNEDFVRPDRFDDFAYEDETYDYTQDDKRDTNSKNEFELTSYLKNHKVEEPYPSPPRTYDPRIKDSAEESTKTHSGHTDLNNIYKFQDLEMLYDPKHRGSIENVQDRQTLEYLQENDLRDDLYIGKDGNLYIKDLIKKRIDRFGNTGQRTNSRQPTQRKVDLNNSKEKELKRSSYTTINRANRQKGPILTTK